MSDDAYSDQLAAKNRELSFKLGKLRREHDTLARENAELRLTHEQWKREYLEDLSVRLQKVLRRWL